MSLDRDNMFKEFQSRIVHEKMNYMYTSVLAGGALCSIFFS